MKRFSLTFLTTLLLFLWGSSLPVKAELVNEANHFACTFATQDELDQWTAIDLNGRFASGNSKNFWEWYADGPCVRFRADSGNNGDDWLISPLLGLKPGKTYTLSFTLNSEDNSRLKFTLGNAATVEAQTFLIKDTETYQDGTFTVEFTVPADITTPYLGIYTCTEAWEETYIYKVAIDEKVVEETYHYECSFTTQDELDQWTAIDLNGRFASGNSKNFWEWYADGPCVRFRADSGNNGDDWLISPLLGLKPGKTYTLSFTLNSEDNSRLKFTLGNAATVEAQTFLIKDTETYQDGTFTVEFTVPADITTPYLGIYTCTEAWEETYIYKVAIDEKVGTPEVNDYFFTNFASQAEFDQWTTIDLNGTFSSKNKWEWYADDVCVRFRADSSHEGDDWLFSPALSLVPGKEYVVKFLLDSQDNTRMKVTLGTDQTVEAQTLLIQDTQVYGSGYFALAFTPTGTESVGTYYLGLHITNEGWEETYLKLVEVTENKDMTLAVSTTDQNSQSALEGVNITLTNDPTYPTQARWSDAEGVARFEHLTPGTYTLNATKDGYIKLEGQTVDIAYDASGQATLNLQLAEYGFCSVSGTVVDESNAPVAQATVRLSGDNSYEITTNENGQFTFAEVPRPQTYTLTISKQYKSTHTQEVSLTKFQEDLGSIVLKDFVSTPANLCTDETEKGMFLSWMMPVAEKEFARDNGIYSGIYQFNNEDGYVQVGTVFKEPMVVEKMTWAIADMKEGILIDAYVYLINKDGSFSITPAYTAKEIPSHNYDFEGDIIWTEHTLTKPVVAPYGCIVAIGRERTISVPNDGQNNGHNVLGADLDKSGWGESGVSNFFIRAAGQKMVADLDATAVSQRAAIKCAPQARLAAPAETSATETPFHFNLWRFATADADNQEAWTVLATEVKDLYYVDMAYNSLASGTYRYAVQAVYDNGKQTDIILSDIAEKQIYTNVTVKIYGNTAIDFTDGTVITLINASDNTYTYSTVVKGGTAQFNQVRKGVYIVTAYKEGFKPVTKDGNFFDLKDQYQMSFGMELEPTAPFNLRAEAQSGTANVVLSWNESTRLFDDFEGMEDFAVNPAGELGWTYVDGDQCPTMGIQQCQANPYPNMFGQMAFIAFNPSATQPVMTDYLVPFSGNKVLASIAPGNNAQNDDYLFSPALSFDTDFTLSFMASAGFYGLFGREEFMVGYCTETATTDNITWITEQPESVNGVWTAFSYTLPKEARHAVIRCVSTQRYFFLLDDIEIGQAEPETFYMASFNIELDNEAYATTNQRSIVLQGLEEGKHIARVQAAFPMSDNSRLYSDYVELVFKVEAADGISTAYGTALFVQEEQAIVAGEATDMMEMFDVQGRSCGSCQANGRISTQDLNAGVYLLKLQVGEQTRYRKVVIR